MGLEALLKNNQGLPVKITQSPEYKLKESYIKIGKLMGMDIGNKTLAKDIKVYN